MQRLEPVVVQAFVAEANGSAGPLVNLVESAQGAVSVTAESGATVSVVLTGTLGSVTKSLAGTGAAQDLALSASEVTQLGQGAVTVTSDAVDAAGNHTLVTSGGDFTLATVAPLGTTSSLNVLGTYTLQMGDFGFTQVNGDLSGVKITNAVGIYLNNALISNNTTVSVSDLLAGHLEWRATSNSSDSCAISFQVIDFARNTSTVENVLTLAHTVSASAVLDVSGSKFEKVDFTGTWAQAYNDAISKGGHLATFEVASQYNTGLSVWGATPTVASYIGLEQSSDGAEPGTAWHWIGGAALNTATTPWAVVQPNDTSDVGGITSAGGLDDIGGTVTSYIIEYENTAFVYRGLAGQADVMVGSSSNDVIAGMGGADSISAGAGNDRIVVPDLAFAMINGGAGVDVLEFTGAMTIGATALVGKAFDIEGILLGTGTQSLALSFEGVKALSSTSDTLYVSKDGTDTVTFSEGVGTAANQWHAVDTVAGSTLYQYFDAQNVASSAKVLM